MEKILKCQEGRKNMVRAETQAKLTDLRTQADADIYQGSHYPRPYDKFKTIWFERIEIIQSMLSKLKGDKPESGKETKEHPYITHWSEGLEGREEYIELSESSKVSELAGLKRR